MNLDFLKNPENIKLVLKKYIKIVLPISIVLAGMIVAIVIVKTKAKPQRIKPIKPVPVVKVLELKKEDLPVIVNAMGTVTSIRKVNLQPRVSGEVIKVNPRFTDGGYLKKGEYILQIEDQDYKLAVEEKKAQLEKAQADLKLEMGKQDVALQEWKLMNPNSDANKLDRELALRKPQLNTANANIEINKAALEQAKLNLQRTTIKAPFDCIVLTKNVDLGSQLSTQDIIAQIVATEKYWIEASVPVDRLKWISIPSEKNQSNGSKVKIKYEINQQSSLQRTGTVEKMLGNLEPEGRMARILIAVKDPLNLKNNNKNSRRLILGEYVRVEIEGKKLSDIFTVPRDALHDNDQLWILGKDQKLEIRKIKTVWRDDKTVLIRNNLKDGEKVILSDLSTPVEAMELTTDSKAVK